MCTEILIDYLMVARQQTFMALLSFNSGILLFFIKKTQILLFYYFFCTKSTTYSTRKENGE
jgi:hypothetical protein